MGATSVSNLVPKPVLFDHILVFLAPRNTKLIKALSCFAKTRVSFLCSWFDDGFGRAKETQGENIQF